MSACGRKLPVDFDDFRQTERPLWMKADIQPGTREKATSEWLLYARKQTFASEF